MEPISATAIAVAVAVAGIKLVLPPLIKKLASKLGGDVTPAEMKNLDHLVRYKIATFIEEAKSNGLAESKPVLEDLQATVLELEDLLDQYKYKQIGEQVSPSNPIKKLMPRTLRLKSSLRNGLEKLLEYVEQVDKILVSSTTSKAQPQANTITPTTSTLLSPYSVRESQHNRIIEFLLDESRANEVPVIAITGIEGSGKTLTAQHICNDVRIRKHFKANIWVHVTCDFDVVGLTRKMLESATNDVCPNFENFDTLQKKLIEILLSKQERFLCVLDDVWCEDKTEWDLLVGPLNEAARNGSKIIITTRIEYIANALGAEIVEIGKLDDCECWSIIKCNASDERREMTEDEGLLYVKNEVISKLKESPQALMAVGRSSRDDESAVMDHLLKCYNSLPWHLQQCFAYCSLFPKGYKFYIDFNEQEPHLISLWIAHGFIKSTGGLTLEEAGKNCFKELVLQSFFENKSEDYFVIPDLLHNLAERVSANLCHRVEDYGSLNIPARCIHLSFCTPENSECPSISDLKAEVSKLTNLRTLIILCGPVLKIIFQNGKALLSKLTNLRALYIHPNQLLEANPLIDNHKLLRYLHVGYGKKLPNPLVKLYLLQIFILITNRVISLQNDHKCLKAGTLPKDFDNLTSLRTLKFYAECGNELDYLCYNSKMIDVGKLKSLQNLMAFHPEKDGPKGMMALRGLSLCGLLSILNLENLRSKVEAEKAMLNQKRNLNKLIFEWSNTRNHNLNTYADVLEGLEPQGNLEKLQIVGYQGYTLPDWMNRLPRLQSLTLQSCTNLGIFPLLPPCLQCLKVSDYNGLMRLSFVGDTGHNLILYDYPKSLLPSIFYMSYDLCMLTIEECSINDIDLSFLKNLKYLYLVGLPSLQTIINLSHTATDLTIQDCPELNSMGNLECCTSLERLKIRKCPMLLGEVPSLVEGVVEGDMANRLPQAKHIETDEPLLVLKLVQQQGFSSIQGLALFGSNGFFPPTLVGCFHQLSSLRRLVLIDFKTLPNLRMLSSLEKLNILDCPDVEELPALPDSAKSITLRKCPKLKVNYEEGGPRRNTISHIPDIRVYN